MAAIMFMALDHLRVGRHMRVDSDIVVKMKGGT